MTALPLRDFTDAERAKLEAIEAAPAAAEAVRERVARALWDATYSGWDWDDDTAEAIREYFRANADAAIAVLRGASSGAEQAVERVLAACDRLDAWLAAEIVTDNGFAEQLGGVVIDDIRAAIAGPPC
jgi:hypothetical protein